MTGSSLINPAKHGIKKIATALVKKSAVKGVKKIKESGEHQGETSKVTWIDENASMSQTAQTYNDSVSGARSNATTQKSQTPSIKYSSSGQERIVRFDGAEGSVMIDRKLSTVTTDKVKNQALRQSEALHQNGLTGRWEVPNQTQQARAEKLFSDLNITNIEVKISHVPTL